MSMGSQINSYWRLQQPAVKKLMKLKETVEALNDSLDENEEVSVF